MLKNNNFICSVDLGSSKLTALAVVFDKKGSICDLYFDSVSSKGLKKGHITDFSDLSLTLDGLLKNMKAKSGLKIKDVLVNTSGSEVVTRFSRAIMPLTQKGNRQVEKSDIDYLNKQARILGERLDDEIIHDAPVI